MNRPPAVRVVLVILALAPLCLEARAEAPRINRVEADRPKVAVYETVELAIDLTAKYDNPFDPDDIVVDADVATPDGRSLRVPGFYAEPMKLTTVDGTERVEKTGDKGGFRVRFAPTVAGAHQIQVLLKDRNGTARSEKVVVEAVAGDSNGFIRVAPKSPRYFAFDSGKSYFAVGENVCWSGWRTPIAEYSAWFAKLGEAGGNWARLWLANNEKGLEWSAPPTEKQGTGTYEGLGRYAQDNAWRLDQVVRLARENGVYLMFCFGTYGEFTEGGFFNEGMWISNPYNKRNGGPCDEPEDFWTNDAARALYKKRLRYLIARWGASTNVFAWEFWNEIPAKPAVNAWTAEMAAFLKQNDPYGHLVSTSYGDDDTWRCADIDFTMTHMYGQAGNTADFTSRIQREVANLSKHEKPYLLAEFGIDWQAPDRKWDPRGTGVNMHNGAWTALMSGAAGTSMVWWWDNYVHPLNVYGVFTPVRRFADAIDWAHTRFEPLGPIALEQPPDHVETFADLTIPASLGWGRPPSTEYTVATDGSVKGEPVAMTIGSPKRGRPGELATQLTWRLDCPRPTRAVVKLGEVSNRSHLVIALDGETKIDRPLPTGEPGKGPWKTSRFAEPYKIWVADYDESIPVDIPAGKHALTISNTDGDWLQIRSLTLPAYRSSRHPDVSALGLQSPDLVVFWLHNHESTWKTDFDGRRPSMFKALRASISLPSPGRWRVEWWDTRTGEVLRGETAEAKDSTLNVVVPDFDRDLAAKLIRER